MNEYVVGIASNINPHLHCKMAIQELSRFDIIYQSSFLWTKPVGYKSQLCYYNAAIILHSDLDSATFKNKLRAIETLLGRTEGIPKYHPRTMDLDILLINGIIKDEDIYTRSFLKENILEVSSYLTRTSLELFTFLQRNS